MHKQNKWLCPICGFQELPFQPYSQDQASFEICPSCFNQFGYDDASVAHTELREQWLTEGMPWKSQEDEPEHWATFKRSISD